MLYSLPVHVALQYSKWHEEYKKGTFRKQAGGPVVGTREQVLGVQVAESEGDTTGIAEGELTEAEAEFLADQLSRVAGEVTHDAGSMAASSADEAAVAACHTFLPEGDESAYLAQVGACGAGVDTSAGDDGRLLMQLRAELACARRESLVLRQQVQLSSVAARTLVTPVESTPRYEDATPPTPSREYAVGCYSPFRVDDKHSGGRMMMSLLMPAHGLYPMCLCAWRRGQF